MAAIITDDFRRNQARLLVNDIKASGDPAFDSTANSSSNSNESNWPYRGNNRYAIGLGKADKWPNDASSNAEDNSSFIIPSPEGTSQENNDIISNLFTLKDIPSTNVKQLVAKNPWTTGRKYKVYDQTDDDMFYSTGDVYPCVVSYANKIYMCLSNTAVVNGFSGTAAASTTIPAPSVFGVTATPNSDGYVWTEVAGFNSNDALATSQFSPVDPQTLTAAQIQKTGGLLTHIGLSDAGTGYSSAPTVTLTLATSSHQAISSSTISLVPTIVGGAIARIDIRDVSTNPTHAGSYEYWKNEASGFLNSSNASRIAYATVTISGGSPTRAAKAYASIAPITGFAKNALDILPAWFVGMHTDFDGSETDGDSPILKFRQVSLLKNVVRAADGLDSDSGILDCLNSITLSGVNSTNMTNLVEGTALQAGASKFYYDYYVATTATTGKLFYHQNSNSEVNQIVPPALGTTPVTVIVGGTAIAADITAVDLTQEYDAFIPNSDNPDKRNGEVIFLENRQPFTRSTTQTEEVKLVIQL
tara:strand:+ start:10099 stop:11688 length:1590 start_codon:yes stop_codon:yes gene_type:complete